MNIKIGGGGVKSTFKAFDWAIKNAPIQHMDKLVDAKSIVGQVLVENCIIGQKQLDELLNPKPER